MDPDEFKRLLALNYAVVAALRDKKPRDREFVYTDALASKLFLHAVTAFNLWSEGTRLRIPGVDSAVDFVDWSSVDVLARACIETYIAFHYVYVEPVTDDEFQFRFNAWMLGGFTKRESFPVFTDEGKTQIAIDAKVNEKHRKRIQRTTRFHGLSRRQQREALAGRNWHPGATLSTLTGEIFGPKWGPALYAFVSSYAHSDALSAVQIQQTRSKEKASELAKASVTVIAVVVALMTEAYAKRFVAARKALRDHPDRALNEMYASFARYAP